MSTVPGNALQEQFHRNNKNAKHPAFGVQGEREAKLLKVFDRDTISATNIPLQLAKSIQNHPGKLYGLVQVSSGTQFYLAFKDPAEMIYSTYGDSNSIEGRLVSIVYYDRNLHTGKIVMKGNEQSPLTDTVASTVAFDIGGIF